MSRDDLAGVQIAYDALARAKAYLDRSELCRTPEHAAKDRERCRADLDRASVTLARLTPRPADGAGQYRDRGE